MKIAQQKYSTSSGWERIGIPHDISTHADLVLVFGSPDLIQSTTLYDELRANYPKAIIMMNSTAGEINDISVHDETIALSAISFERTTLQSASVHILPDESSFAAGARLASQFDPAHLNNVLVISDGQHVNGSELVKGLQQSLPSETIITGGLAGDGVNFRKTLVGLNASATEGCIAAIGFYGSAVTVSYGTVGGWDPFGPERLITRSAGNILYELDGKPALEIYKQYLGEYAAQLPSSGLHFPLSIRNGGSDSLVRTILGVNDADNSLIFAGNMPEGCYARLMKASPDRLIEGAGQAAHNSLQNSPGILPDLAILISCVGRKLVLNQRIEEEVEIIREAFGPETAITGFYSYGEISPSYNSSGPELHNQTMTITTFTEALI
jgi:hypothetical protein